MTTPQTPINEILAIAINRSIAAYKDSPSRPRITTLTEPYRQEALSAIYNLLAKEAVDYRHHRGGQQIYTIEPVQAVPLDKIKELLE